MLCLEWIDDDNLVTGGLQHIYFWNISSFKKQRGALPSSKGRVAILALARIPGSKDILAGASTGELIRYSGRSIKSATPVHKVS